MSPRSGCGCSAAGGAEAPGRPAGAVSARPRGEAGAAALAVVIVACCVAAGRLDRRARRHAAPALPRRRLARGLGRASTSRCSLAFAATAWAAWRRRQVLIICLVVLATLLCCDAWFDVVLDCGTPGLLAQPAAALVVELPLAVLAIIGARRLLRLTIGMVCPREGDPGRCRRSGRCRCSATIRPEHGYRDLFRSRARTRTGPGRSAAGGTGAGRVTPRPAARAGSRAGARGASGYDGAGSAASSAASARAGPGSRNREPAASSRRGSTRALASMSLDTCRARAAAPAAGTSSPGRCTAAASAEVNSALVTGCGAVRFTGPVISGWSSRKRTIADVVRQRDPAHELGARPQPGAQPEPEQRQQPAQHPAAPGQHDTGAQLDHADAGLAAGRAAASQSLTTPARKPEPAGADSSTSRPPVSPYQPMAEPDSRTDGGAAPLRRQRAGQCPGAPDPAGPDLSACRPRSSGRPRSAPRQVDDGVEAVQGAGGEPAGRARAGPTGSRPRPGGAAGPA